MHAAWMVQPSRKITQCCMQQQQQQSLENNYTPDTNFLFEDSLSSAKGTNKENSSWQRRTEWFYEKKINK